MPGKAENGPSEATSAMLMRQPKVSKPEPSGKAAISAVVPPPFFHGMRGSGPRRG